MDLRAKTKKQKREIPKIPHVDPCGAIEQIGGQLLCAQTRYKYILGIQVTFQVRLAAPTYPSCAGGWPRGRPAPGKTGRWEVT